MTGKAPTWKTVTAKMMTGKTVPRRWLAWSAALCLALGLTLTMLPSQPAQAKDKQSAIDIFGGCLVSQKAGDLLLLIDESKSLEQNDPKNARVTAAQYLLGQLQDFSSRAKVDLDVSVTGFAMEHTTVSDWTRLDAKGAPELKDAVASFADRRSGIQTDYWSGLEGARRSLASRVKGDQNRCQAIVWITDGKLDLSLKGESGDDVKEYGSKSYAPDADLTTDPGISQAQEAAEKSLCRPGGMADQLRQSKVSLLAVGLASKETKASDFDTMKAIATGKAGDTTCGKITEPTPGEFTLASNIDDLLFAFDRIQDPGRKPTQQEAGVCQGKVCTDEGHNVVLDNSLKNVHILASADVKGLDVALVQPGGKVIKLPRQAVGKQSSTTSGGVKINHTWQSDKTLSVDLQRSGKAKAWSGLWSLVFIDPASKTPDAKSRSNIHVSGDIYPAWPGAAKITLRAGEVNKNVALGLADADQKKIDPKSLLGKASLDAALETADGTEIPVAKNLGIDEISKPRNVDLKKAKPGKATMRLTLSVTTASTKDAQGKRVPGTQLSPQVVNLPVRIAPPPGFPVLGQANFGSIEGDVDSKATVDITGPGCVWVPENTKPKINTGPDTLGKVQVGASGPTSQKNCIKVKEGEQGQLELRLQTDEPGNGTLNGTIDVSMSPLDAPDRATTTELPFTADLRKPLNTTNFALALIAALILGPGIPLGLLYLTKWITAKIPGRALLSQSVPVSVVGDQVLRDGAPFALRDNDLTEMVRLSNQGSRSTEAGGTTLATHIGRSPFGAGHVLAETPGLVGASSTDPQPYGKTQAARLPLAIHNTWLVQHDPTGPADQARLLLLVSADATGEQRQDLVDDVNRRLPDVLASLRSSAEMGGGMPTMATAQAAGASASTTGAAPAADPFGFDHGNDVGPNPPAQPSGPIASASNDGPTTGSGNMEPGAGNVEPGSGSGSGSGNDEWSGFDFSFGEDENGDTQ